MPEQLLAGSPPLTAERVAAALDDFYRRLALRDQVEDIAALLVEDCLGEFRARRALYAAVDAHDGALAVRFAVGFDGAVPPRIPLSSDHLAIVAATLAGRVTALTPADLAASGLAPRADGEDGAGGSAVAVPLFALPLLSGPKLDVQPRCPLPRYVTPARLRCFEDKNPHPDAALRDLAWETRIRTLCPDCPVFGPIGVVVAERTEPFSAEELLSLGLRGRATGQRARAVDVIGRIERSAERLRKEREWLDTVMASAADPIVVTDLSNALVLQNRRAEELLVAAADDSVGKRRAIAINDITFSAYLSSHSIDPRRVPRELPLVHPIEGSDLLFEAISTPAYAASGQRIGAVTVLRDVTDLQKATQALHQQLYKYQKAEFTLRQERDRLNLILQSAVDPIVVTNLSNDIVLANGEGDRLFQAEPGDPPSRQKAVVVNDANFSSFLTEFLADFDDKRKRDLRLIDPATDEVRSFEVTAGKVRNDRGQPVAAVSVFHDVTKLQELERRRLEQMLFESEKLAATGRLAASIAHEMNNPLESIKNSLYLLRSRIPASDPAATFLGIAQKESERVSNIIRQFLGFYRPAVTMLPVNLPALIDDELKLVENQLGKRKIEVVRHFAKLPPVLGSEDQLKQVFLNLILNAIEAMSAGGTLTVTTRFERQPTAISAIAPAARVTVGDTGSGILPEHLPSLFEPFFTTKSEKGTGLGLWVCYGIVRAHKGDIKVETQVGVGTQFHVILPVRGDAAEGSGR
jgi:PAS domain S-box-containing protein